MGTDVFGEQISAGTLQMEELKRMVAVTFRHIDLDGTGSITCGEFIHSFMSGELVTVPTMARYFDDDIKVGPVRLLLDSSWHERAHEIKLWKAAQQAKAESLTGESESNGEDPQRQVSNQSEEKLAKTVNDAGTNGLGLTLGQDAWQPPGFEAVFRRLDALEAEAEAWERRLSSMEALTLERRLEELNLRRRVATLEADEISRRENSLRITQREEDDTVERATITVLTGRVDELYSAMIELRNEVCGLDNEAMAGREQCHDSRFDSFDSGSYGNRVSKGMPGDYTAPSSSCFAFPPTDRKLGIMPEEAPPIWNINPDEEEASTVKPSSSRWTGLPTVGEPSRENTVVTGISDSCLSKELREDSGSTLTTALTTSLNTWRTPRNLKFAM